MWNIVFFIFLFLFGEVFAAQTTIYVKKSERSSIPISITKQDCNSEFAGKVHTVIFSDLAYCGNFTITTPQMSQQTHADIILSIIDDKHLIRTKLKIKDNRVERIIEGLSLSANKADWRKMSHVISDIIYEKLIGGKPFFNSKIVYVATHKVSRYVVTRKLAIMDSNGENQKILTDNNAVIMNPRISPNLRDVVFFAYTKSKNPRRPNSGIYILNLHNGSYKKILGGNNMYFAPRFSRDGLKIGFSGSGNQKTNIFIYDVLTKKISQITKNNCIDTSPSFSPDGKRIVFNSDRTGTPNIYIMNVDGTDQRQISDGDGKYFAPCWSPDGYKIACVKIDNGKFYLCVIDMRTKTEKKLVSGYVLDSPSWSPNSSFIVFASTDRRNNSKIFMINIHNGYIREVITPTGGEDPDWSALIK